MRHFRSSPLAIATLTLGMREASPARFLITPIGLPQGLAAGGFRAPLTAVNIAPVAVAADRYLAATAGAVEQACTALHRALRPMRAGLEPKRERYSPVGRASHGLGARYREDCGGRDRCRACLNGPVCLSDSVQPVTPCDPLPTSQPSGIPPSPSPEFTTLDGDSPRRSPKKRAFRKPFTAAS